MLKFGHWAIARIGLIDNEMLDRTIRTIDAIGLTLLPRALIHRSRSENQARAQERNLTGYSVVTIVGGQVDDAHGTINQTVGG
ncbi:hypothetical protein ACQ4M4_22295 [Leptolyngbya sp. AN02str]